MADINWDNFCWIVLLLFLHQPLLQWSKISVRTAFTGQNAFRQLMWTGSYCNSTCRNLNSARNLYPNTRREREIGISKDNLIWFRYFFKRFISVTLSMLMKKVKFGNTFRGGNCVKAVFVFSLQRGLKPFLYKTVVCRKANRKSQNLPPFQTFAE